VEGSCEHGNEPPGSIKCREVTEWLYNWRLLKKAQLHDVFQYVSLMRTLLLIGPIVLEAIILVCLSVFASVENSTLRTEFCGPSTDLSKTF
jgi:hypothetical protein